jgi:hypothetical protein
MGVTGIQQALTSKGVGDCRVGLPEIETSRVAFVGDHDEIMG